MKVKVKFVERDGLKLPVFRVYPQVGTGKVGLAVYTGDGKSEIIEIPTADFFRLQEKLLDISDG